MEKKQLHYDAFISYRHNDLDKFVATNLHHLLETYKLPKSIIKNNNLEKTKIERVFRDQEELPLSNSLEDPIVKALENSDYLIVICSPRLKESIWCKKEIETFIKLHGRSRVLAVLVEGEPVDSFPKELLYDEKTKKEIEPLALDCRGNSKKEVLANLKKELLRLIAPMFNLNYDDLKRRHHERKIKNIIRLSVISSIVLFLFLVYAGINLIFIKVEQQLILHLWSVNLADESKASFKEDDREAAIKKAYQAITKYDSMKMPKTAEGITSLTDALDPYDIGKKAKSAFNINTKGIANNLKMTKDYNYLLIYDTSNTLTLVDKDYKTIYKYTDLISTINGANTDFVLFNNNVVYLNKDNKLVVKDYKGKTIKTLDKGYKLISMDDYLIVSNLHDLTVYDKEYKVIYTYKVSDKIDLDDLKVIHNKNLIFGESASFTDSKANHDITKFNVINLDTKEVRSFELGIDLGLDYIIEGNNLYIKGNSYNLGENNKLYIYKYDLKTLNEVWHTKIENVYGSAFGISDHNNYLLVSSSSGAYLIKASNGEIDKNFSLGTSVTRILTYTNSDDFFVICNDGTYYGLGPKYKTALMNGELYQFNAGQYDKVYLFNNDILGIPYNDNRVIVYQKRDNKKEEITKYNYKPVSQRDTDIEEAIKSYPSMKKALVNGYVKVKSENIILFSFRDNTIEIYDTQDKELLSEIKDVTHINNFLGKDKEGNLYFNGNLNGIVLNEDYERIANIESLVGIDKKNNKVIIKYGDKYYKMPIYATKDLLKMAKDYLNKYDK